MATFTDEFRTIAAALLRLDPWAAIPAPKTCGCGTTFLMVTPQEIRSPTDDETCILCRGEGDADRIPVEHDLVVEWICERQALVRMAERIIAESKAEGRGELDQKEVEAELMAWEQIEGFRVLLRKLAVSAPTRQSAWDAAMRIWIQGPEVAALGSPLVAKITRRRAGLEVDPLQVERVTAKLKGLKVLDGPIVEVAQRMLDMIEKHGRDLVIGFKMRDGTKQRWRGNGVRLA